MDRPTLALRLHLHPHPDHHSIEVDQAEAAKLISQIGAALPSLNNSAAPFEIPAVIVNLMAANFREIVKALGGIDQTVAVAQAAYAKYVQPINLPSVPRFLSPTVDHAIVYGIGVMLHNAWEKVNDPNAPLVPLGRVGSANPTLLAAAADHARKNGIGSSTPANEGEQKAAE